MYVASRKKVNFSKKHSTYLSWVDIFQFMNRKFAQTYIFSWRFLNETSSYLQEVTLESPQKKQKSGISMNHGFFYQNKMRLSLISETISFFKTKRK